MGRGGGLKGIGQFNSLTAFQILAIYVFQMAPKKYEIHPNGAKMAIFFLTNLKNRAAAGCFSHRTQYVIRVSFTGLLRMLRSY